MVSGIYSKDVSLASQDGEGQDGEGQVGEGGDSVLSFLDSAYRPDVLDGWAGSVLRFSESVRNAVQAGRDAGLFPRPPVLMVSEEGSGRLGQGWQALPDYPYGGTACIGYGTGGIPCASACGLPCSSPSSPCSQCPFFGSEGEVSVRSALSDDPRLYFPYDASLSGYGGESGEEDGDVR